MFPDVYALLHTAAVQALVGDRIYRHGVAPQAAVGPYVTWSVSSGVPQNVLDDTPPADAFAVQVNCWSSNTGNGASGVNTLAAAVRDAIEASYHITDFQAESQDPETQRYRVGMTFTYWAHRSG